MPNAVLKFDKTLINVVYTSKEGVPYIWCKCAVVYYKGQYLLQVPNDGGRRHNRRNSFRVGVSQKAKLLMNGNRGAETMVHDVSLTGFSITDRKDSLDINMGSHIALQYEDMGYELELEGDAVRKQVESDYVIYGFIITKANRDLTSYVTNKQRRKRIQNNSCKQN
jgi:hypothetical protein